jgi:hypothetical protein
MEVAWLGSIIVMAFALIRGLRFRRGSDRSMLGLYRNTTLPAMYRHAPLALPFTSGYVLALLLLGGARALLGPIGSGNVLDLILTTMGGVSFLLAFAVTIVRMYAPPQWLTPAWLALDDELVGYIRPKPDWADKVWLVIASAVVAAALLFAVYAAVVIVRTA